MFGAAELLVTRPELGLPSRTFERTILDVLVLLLSALTRLFRSRARLEAEILVLWQQIDVLRRKSPKRLAFGSFDRMVFVGLYRLIPGIVDALSIQPETVVRVRWKSVS